MNSECSYGITVLLNDNLSQEQKIIRTENEQLPLNRKKVMHS